MSDHRHQNHHPAHHHSAGERRHGTHPNDEAAAKNAASEDPETRAQSQWELLSDIETMMNEFIEDFEINTNLTGKERQRLFGAGVRNFGFIEKAYDIGVENPDFLPRNFNIQMMESNLRDLEEARQLYWLLQQFLNAANEYMLMRADICFKDALRVYGNLREMARARVPGADVLYHSLLTFFRRRKPRNTDGSEPTQKELERDFMKLIHGHADGDIEIINEQPHFTGGVRKIIDNVHTGHTAIQETGKAEVKE